jgi:DNA-directed RNA polymerase specialized sigma24 family protein
MTHASRLTAGSLGRLLDLLDADRDRAAIAYEKLRERTAGLLQWWGATHPDELADETLDRVGRKLDEGAPVTQSSLAAYVRGVARLVFYESRRADRNDPLPRHDLAAPQPEGQSDVLECLDECLASLDSSDRDVVLRYYDGNKVAVRQRIASDLNISMTALRIRMHRLRMRLESCVEAGLKRLGYFEHPLQA